MAKKHVEVGTTAVAMAMRQINPDVVAAYPITPQTAIVQTFSQYVADGKVDTEFITVESEHSAMSACVGAAAAGARVMTATASAGLALMWEILSVASGLRVPITMVNVNRALSAPINIHCDHSDSMGARDSGWIQIYSENSQEAYDNVIQAIRIAESEEVRLPVMVMLDGFIISHGIEEFETLEDEEVKNFIGENKPKYSLLDVKEPVTHGPLQLFDYYFETKRQQANAIYKSRTVIEEVEKEYEKLSSRSQPTIEKYFTSDAELLIVVLSSTAGTVKNVVKELRKDGIKVGLIKPRIFRPFPYFELAEVIKNVKAVAVLDRSCSFGAQGGPLYIEIRSALYELVQKPLIKNYIYGLGGRDISLENIRSVYSDLEKMVKTGRVEKPVSYLGVRK